MERGRPGALRRRPGLRLILVTGRGHGLRVEHENMFNRACLDFP